MTLRSQIRLRRSAASHDGKTSVFHHPNSSMMPVLISHIVVRGFNCDEAKRRPKFSPRPKMSFRISKPYFFVIPKKKIRRPSFQKLQRHRRRHRERNRRRTLNVVWLHVQLNPFYLMFRRCSSETSLRKLSIFPLSENLVPALRAELELPHRNADAVIPPFIFVLESFIALAKH